ncbi:MAG: hypothetical protein WAW17_27210, partial [Rhodococcus sp. (in: high G+C Gram-positive bacteria)]|uniref:hypothetical protein n=1 Tax=Rhodococcus sp. TaxID=1831 RepID=UPI003BB0E722
SLGRRAPDPNLTLTEMLDDGGISLRQRPRAETGDVQVHALSEHSGTRPKTNLSYYNDFAG